MWSTGRSLHTLPWGDCRNDWGNGNQSEFFLVGNDVLYAKKKFKKSSSFEAVLSIHCLAALGLGARLKQPFNCLIIQNHQNVAVHGVVNGLDIWRQHGWKLFFCDTLTGCRGDVKKVVLTDSAKAALKSILLPVPLTVMKKPHKDNLQNSTLNPAVTHGIPKKQRKNHAKQ